MDATNGATTASDHNGCTVENGDVGKVPEAPVKSLNANDKDGQEPEVKQRTESSSSDTSSTTTASGQDTTATLDSSLDVCDADATESKETPPETGNEAKEPPATAPVTKSRFWLGFSRVDSSTAEVVESGDKDTSGSSSAPPVVKKAVIKSRSNSGSTFAETDRDQLPGSPGGTGIPGSDDNPKEKLIRSLKKEVKHIMEESVMLKCVHEDSSSITQLCSAIDSCLSFGLKRRALGLFKTK